MTHSTEVHILIVDDDDMSKFLTGKIIQNHSPRILVDAAKSAKEALNRVRNPETKLPDIIIVDLNMPEMNGFEFIEEFRKLDLARTHLPQIVIASSSLSLDDLRRANALRVPFFSKPLLDKDIKSIVSLLN